MEPDVLRAMAKWPQVPDVFGWLALDARGRYLLKGEPITHPLSKAFIARNYACDKNGRWFFQNGPQRVFVQLMRAPWVFSWDGQHWRHQGGDLLQKMSCAALDENHQLYFATNCGLGVVDDRDLARAAAMLETPSGQPFESDAVQQILAGDVAEGPLDLVLKWQGEDVPVQGVACENIARHFGFVRDPAPA